jgi:two-component system, cell cycle response regulator DivK
MAPLILLVDDFQDALEMYGEYLVYHGYRVVTASNGEEALTAASAECPDVILMDVQMPVMNGVDALRILRTREVFARVPIVALTAHALADQRRRMLMEGFDEVIPKPCLPNDLVIAIERLLQTRRTAAG